MAKRWLLKGYQSTNQPQPDVVVPYDGTRREYRKWAGGVAQLPPVSAETHLYALLDKDKSDCTFAEIVDLDSTLTLVGEHGEEEKRFLTVRAVER